MNPAGVVDGREVMACVTIHPHYQLRPEITVVLAQGP
jgi:hypothetical protein